MRIIVTGVKGQLGYDVVSELNKRGHEAIGIDKDEVDITSFDKVEGFFNHARADAVIHCAAYTAVDAAQDNEEAARKVNKEGTGNIACMCKKLNMKMLYISTEYIFNGQGERPWKPEDESGPLSVYGQTKYEGELEVKKYLKDYFIVRISWAFGINGSNFVKTMLRLSNERNEIKVVDDQIGSPTYTKDLSRLLVDMVESKRYGIYHAANSGYVSWYDFACEIFRLSEIKVNIMPVDSGSFPVKAIRPKNSRMNMDKLSDEGFVPLRHWKEALFDYLTELKNL